MASNIISPGAPKISLMRSTGTIVTARPPHRESDLRPCGYTDAIEAARGV
jgi:hypothetical protein